MPDYSKAKIYRVFCGDDEYIGSTIRPLSERMNGHRCSFRTNGLCSSKVIFEKHGIENVKIELIEEYPCQNREQLEKREGEIQRERKCVNHNIAGRTIKEYKQDNTEKFREYYLDHAEKIREQSKQYYLDHTEKFREYHQQYHIQNAEKIKEYNRQYYLKKKQEKNPIN